MTYDTIKFEINAGVATLTLNRPERLNAFTDAMHVDIRAALFSPDDIEYSVKQDDFVMEIMLEAARFLLQETPSRKIFLDGRTFSRRYQIDRVLEFARELAQPWAIIECACSDESARRRLDLETNAIHPAQNRTFALYLEVKARFEAITYPKTTISTDQSLEQCIEQALAAVTVG